ncbi:MAG: metal ABC transporter permease [Thermoprotei archaeon]|nr:MAG: metal ABC transporter permease [Thermoprotei archaeon]
MILDPRWFIIVISASLTYGAMSPITAARRMYYLASSLPHSALLAAIIAHPLSQFLGGSLALWSLAVGIPLSYIVILLVQRGVPEDVATAVFVSLSVSASVAAIYYVLTTFPPRESLWSYIIGDPLLASWHDTIQAVVISVVSIVLMIPHYNRQVLLGVDRDYASLIGLRIKLYDYLFITSLSLATIGLLKVVGFVMEHVLLLLPASIALNIAKSSYQALLISTIASLAAGLLGLFLSLMLNQAPSATIGFVLLATYLLSLKGVRR